jgi:hypothetical protein
MTLKTGKGILGIPLSEVGPVMQEVAACLVDRGYPGAAVKAVLESEDFDEDAWWMRYGGPAVDGLELMIGAKVAAAAKAQR